MTRCKKISNPISLQRHPVFANYLAKHNHRQAKKHNLLAAISGYELLMRAINRYLSLRQFMEYAGLSYNQQVARSMVAVGISYTFVSLLRAIIISS
ncbi:MAG TPA: hypothetical protein DEF07_07970 [Nitrosomonas sp.]|nr:hypothetical protein [Nitrosomonas sp.]